MSKPVSEQTVPSDDKQKDRRIAVLFSFAFVPIPGSDSIRICATEDVLCPVCGKACLQYRDSVRRICRFSSEKTLFFLIPRGKCPICGTIRREVPAFLCPWKQYPASTIYRSVKHLPHKTVSPDKESSLPSDDIVAIWSRWAGQDMENVRGTPDYVCFSKKAQTSAAQSLAAFLSKMG